MSDVRNVRMTVKHKQGRDETGGRGRGDILFLGIAKKIIKDDRPPNNGLVAVRLHDD